MRQLRLSIAFLLFAANGCSCDEPPPLDDGTVGMDATTPESGPGAMCVPNGQPCSGMTGAACCSGVCRNNLCDEPELCLGPGAACTDNLDCCTNSCVGGVCDQNLCRGVGYGCTDDAECCSRICGGDGTCQVVPAGPGGDSCITLGEACTGTTAGGGCCSTNCQGNTCVRAAGCQANGDICFEHSDCCGNLCSATNGEPGRCIFETGGGGGGCLQGGNPCPNGGTNCCSRVCVDVGAGVPVCQLAGGCRLTGEWCVNDDHCCGGGGNPNGTVVCQDAPLGRCDNGQSCNPVGNICGAPVLPGGGSINASQNCCDGRKEVCKLDSSGIPRCFGGCPNDVCPMECPTGYDPNDPSCCIPTGEECQFRDQCCNYAPCVPNENGILVCGAAPDCVVVGEECTPGAPPGANGCCEGTTCAESSTPGLFVCNPGSIDPGGDRDGGVTDGPIDPNDGGPPPDTGVAPCAGNGAACTAASECCSGICENGMCGAPQQCQPETAACTSSADCCAGLQCNVPIGEPSGTCEQGAECNSTGQACTENSPCCPSLACRLIGTQQSCDGSGACVCVIDL
jgi:hypothetical protein